MSPAHNESTAQQHFEHSNVVEIRNEIMFDFYPGLPHMALLFQKRGQGIRVGLGECFWNVSETCVRHPLSGVHYIHCTSDLLLEQGYFTPTSRCSVTSNITAWKAWKKTLMCIDVPLVGRCTFGDMAHSWKSPFVCKATGIWLSLASSYLCKRQPSLPSTYMYAGTNWEATEQ